MGLEQGMGGDGAGEMMVEVAHPGAPGEEPLQGRPVRFQRQVQDRDLIPLPGVHPGQEGDVPLDPRHQGGGEGFRQAQLLQGAQPVGIAIEDIVISHLGILNMKPGCLGGRLFATSPLTG